ncbi:hypothetical protein [Lysobacter auxotrophicus]|uniref:Uncharacterized protein n=1 Tax=Lysobacter auxotrophicus TaxID=2992573 RepID=A0ABN6UK16_9GAMM|nr:hypothetical protein [Lysobacter auxotrophicus]BDU16589.1 hypothetical protein LA521A_17900 [Lysobacter auxotrophicus]
MRQQIVWCALVAVLVSPSLGAAQPDKGLAAGKAVPYIFQVWDQFVISNAAATVCEPADASSRKSHAANFALVSAHVRARIKAASPRKSDDEINRFLGGREAALARVSTQAAKQKGCNDPEIQQLVRRYQTQLRWRPTGT